MTNKERIIESVLDTDLYKLTMGQAVWNRYPETEARYRFINRGGTGFPQGFDKDVQIQVKKMSGLSLTDSEEQFLKKQCPYLKTEYIEWLKKYKFRPEQTRIVQDGPGNLTVEIEGPWKETIFWEVPLMATISELFYKKTGQRVIGGWRKNAIDKARTLKDYGAKYVEFGTRRRFSRDVQENVLQGIKENCGKEFLGTSNVDLARKMDLIPRGTYAHEWVMGIGGINGVEKANQIAMDNWHSEYGDSLATALTDTYTTPVFLRDYDNKRSLQFPILRQDSGSPERWTDMVVDHIKNKLKKDPRGFTVMYSDALDVPKIRQLEKYADKLGINCLFGIGTNLTNDVGHRPLNMVIKMTAIRSNGHGWVDVIKLSDSSGKISGDIEQIKKVKNQLKI